MKVQVDIDEVEELSERISRVIFHYSQEVRELNASEISLALSLVFHNMWGTLEENEEDGEEEEA